MVAKKDLTERVPDVVLKIVRSSRGRYVIGDQPFVAEIPLGLHMRTALDMSDIGYEAGRQHYENGGRKPSHVEVYKFGKKLEVKVF